MLRKDKVISTDNKTLSEPVSIGSDDVVILIEDRVTNINMIAELTSSFADTRSSTNVTTEINQAN